MSSLDKSYIILSGALRQVLARPQLELELKSKETRRKAIADLNIDNEMATEILNIINDLRRNEPVGPGIHSSPSQDHQEIEADRKFLLESFRQLQIAYRTSITMSVVMFAIGVAFLVMAAIRSFTDPQSVAMNAVIGGIGVVQVVALFYRNPLSHIARTVSNTQRAKLAVMSYLVGIALLNQQIADGQPTDAHMKSLNYLTERALMHLQAHEESDEAKARIATGSTSGQMN